MQPNLKGENFDILGNMVKLWTQTEKILGPIIVCQYTNKHWYHKYFYISLKYWAKSITPNNISMIIALFFLVNVLWIYWNDIKLNTVSYMLFGLRSYNIAQNVVEI